MRGRKRKTTEDFIKEARAVHGDKYDYSKVVYTGVFNDVTIICPEHGEFEQKPREHINGYGCQKCGLKKMWDSRGRKTTEDFIKEARAVHGDKYDYSKVVYENRRKKVEIVCHKKYRNGVEHGAFFQKPGEHLRGKGCPHCRNSRLENVIFKALTESNIMFETEKTFDWLVNKQHMYLDFFIPEKNIAIECQGIGHFLPLNTKIKNYDSEKQFQIVRENDQMKKKLCLENGIKILYFSDRATAKYNETDDIIYTDKDELLRIICEDI